MKHIKEFETWVNEDFAAVGAPPAGNVSGMGNVTPPTATSVGSGDAWPSLGAPSTQLPSKKICPICKKKLKKGICKCNECAM